MASSQELASDQRFSQVTKDPRFWEMPEKENKIKIDKRFRAMFHDKKFSLKYSVDKRGRPIHHNTTEDLKRFYDLSESEESNLSDADSKEMTLKSKKKMVKAKGKLDSGTLLDNVQPEERSKKTKQRENARGLLELTCIQGERQKSSTETDQAKKVIVKKVNLGQIEVKDDQEPSLLGKQKQKSLSALKSGVPRKSKQKALETSRKKAVISPKIKCQLKEKNTESESEADVHEDDEESLQEEKGISSEAPSEDAEADDDPNKEELEEATDEEVDSDLREEEEDESDSEPDIARGRGNVETSSEDEDVEEDFVKEVEFEHAWGELDKMTPRGDQITCRLAVCNMDWDRLKATDLLALFNSFKPKGGVVFSVKIYPSEFGKERLKQEELRGPVELASLTEDVTEEPKIYREKMREYQFSRLKYFYAVVECDCPETANKIYEECDGLEFESSCSFVDLRFIPDDVTFDDEPKDTATDVDLTVYKPKYFMSAATATSKVDITWDETDHDRMTALNKTFKKDEILDMDFQAYLASSSEEEEEEAQYGTGDGAVQATEDNTKNKRIHKNDEEQITKYKELLKGIQEKEKKHEEKGVEMEIKWVPGLKESAEKMVKDKLEGKDKFTPWEQFLQKKKEKRKLKRKKAKREEGPSEDSDELPPDVNFDDPYFSEELGKPDLKNRSKKNQKEEKGILSSEEEADQERHKAEMALLMMDDEEDGRRHFNYEKIVEQQNLSKKKKKWLMKKQELLEDDFQLDVADTRFQAMYTSHLFNVDPSDPNFKNTKAMEEILEEKSRRRAREDVAHTETMGKRQREVEKQQEGENATKKPANPDLSLLIKSVKSKTKQFQAWKNKKSNR
ncbi:ESF1 homolog [Microcaecilia unicolor]|uniref:ESF1 homolog n=1 Tax=Microcaecilia unicolor TaxID=1415580 RepID=A0A6P7XID1_9AMPH|nr:ESF1 homolog [Microcaecilia unicolor]XP_030052203.1 ESF1 homolog [Microcaecilia unicolor]